MAIEPFMLETGWASDLHGGDSTTAACRAVADAIHHNSLPFIRSSKTVGARMLVEATVAVPDPHTVDLEAVKREFPHGEVTVKAIDGGMRVPFGDTILACAAVLVSLDFGEA
jgi:uncharacterized protein (TIGR02058 family)